MKLVTYIGTEDDPTETITHGGFTFDKGTAIEIADDAVYPWFEGNETFTCVDAPVPKLKAKVEPATKDDAE